MSAINKIFVACFLVLHSAAGQEFKFGSCPSVTPVKNFDISQYYGTWYEFGSTPGGINVGHCTTWTFDFSSDTSAEPGFKQYKVTRTSVNPNGSQNSFNTSIFAKQLGNTGKLDAKFEKLVPGIGQAYVVYADNKFVVLFGCKSFGFGSHFEVSYVFTRAQFASKDDYQKITKKLGKNGFVSNSLNTNIQVKGVCQ